MNYELEDIRDFFTKRPILVGGTLLTGDEYSQIKKRGLKLDPTRAENLRWFIRGWKEAKL